MAQTVDPFYVVYESGEVNVQSVVRVCLRIYSFVLHDNNYVRTSHFSSHSIKRFAIAGDTGFLLRLLC